MAIITREQVIHTARLAHLELSEAELSRLVVELDSILAHVAQLEELDTRGVETFAPLAVSAMPLAPDEPAPPLPPASALAEAPRVKEGGFAVPAFVDEA